MAPRDLGDGFVSVRDDSEGSNGNLERATWSVDELVAGDVMPGVVFVDSEFSGEAREEFKRRFNDYRATERYGRAPAEFANAIADIVQRNFGRHVLFGQRYGIAQGVWNYWCEQLAGDSTKGTNT